MKVFLEIFAFVISMLGVVASLSAIINKSEDFEGIRWLPWVLLIHFFSCACFMLYSLIKPEKEKV
jgi:hypothetical protein